MADAPPSWDLYRSFLAILRDGSLSGAARSLGLAQPTLGRHVLELEHRLKISLFTRSQAGLTPTAAALELRPYAEALEASAHALLRVASGSQDEVRGTVRLTASEVISIEVLPPILAELRHAHPGLVIELVVSNRNEDLLRRDADIAVRMVQPTQRALVAKRIGAIELGLHAHPAYLARAGKPRTAADLAQHAVVGFDQPSLFARGLTIGNHAVTREMFSLRADNDLAQLAAIRAGYGIGVCQVPLGRRAPGLVRILPSVFSVPLECWVAMHEDQRATLRCRVVFDALVEGLSAYLKT
ncbi:LysR family transcriptional regulator [Roseiterribacter gracilis]|uniref:LysR family transcriptional regulator n=1 Tax=Roseiterribacter gracilis TaxID=2812848 RepID=A0A8S8XJR5_9PROT|nr:LysR family transcriptional regulator [Rhodospirillales bacterium TMPK1]